MEEYNKTGQVEPRSVADIFEDLRALAQSAGALHEISSLLYRDHVVTVDRHDGRVIDSPEYRWSISKLNKNEVLLLLGLMVQSQTNHTYTAQAINNGFAAKADALFREFHVALILDLNTRPSDEGEDSIGLFAREAIYYGAEGNYLHQFFNFSRKRYREDREWLLQNVGISICSMLDIAKFIIDHINAKIAAVGQHREQGHKFSNRDLTTSLSIAKEDVRKQFGAKSDAFFAKFVSPITATNMGFYGPILYKLGRARTHYRA